MEVVWDLSRGFINEAAQLIIAYQRISTHYKKAINAFL
jgi:hypothetical protein